MSFDSKRLNYSKQHIYIVEMDLEYCSLTEGVGPCTSVATGDAQCFNTRSTSNDIDNFDPTIKTYRFCEKRSPHPIGLAGVIPCLESVSITPSVINIEGGLGARSSTSMVFSDPPHSDINVDKNLIARSYNPLNRGSFWTKLRQRNPNYQYRAIRILSGYLNDDGSYDVDNFQTRHYLIESLTATRGSCTIVAKDTLVLANKKKAKIPAVSTGELSADLTAGVGTLTLEPAGVGDDEYDTDGFLVIQREVMGFNRVSDVCTLSRGVYNTADVDHSEGDTVQQCYYANDQVNVIDEDVLVNFCGIDSAVIPTSA